MSSSVQSVEFTPFGAAAVDPPRSIAIFQALNLGDLLCTTPALRAIRKRFPGAEVTLIGRPWAREMGERLPAVDRFMPFPGFPGIAESPAGGRQTVSVWPPFDLAIQMHGSGSASNGFVASLGATRSLGYGHAGDPRLTTARNWVENEPEPVRWLRLVDALGAAADGLRLDLVVTNDERESAAMLLGAEPGHPVIGFHAGASDAARRWPPDSFAALGDALAAELDAHIVLPGAENEKPLTNQVRTAMQATATDLTGQTTLGQFAAVISALDLLVTNDTGASHVAAAMQTPSIVLFGPSRPERWAPLDLTRHHIIDAGANCATDAERAAALQALPPAFVAARCRAVLREVQVIRERELLRGPRA